MKPHGHAAVTTAMGVGYWFATEDPVASSAVFIVGTCLDIDHLMDWYHWVALGNRTKVFYIFHGWEYLAPALAATVAAGDFGVYSAVLFGLLSHLILDQLVNATKPLTYFVTYRAYHRFEMSKVCYWTLESTMADAEAVLSKVPFLGKRLSRLISARAAQAATQP